MINETYFEFYDDNTMMRKYFSNQLIAHTPITMVRIYLI